MIRKHHRHRPSSFLKSGWKATFSIFSVFFNKNIVKQQHAEECCKKCQNRHFTASKIPKYPYHPAMTGQGTVKEVRSYSSVSVLFTPSTLPEKWFSWCVIRKRKTVSSLYNKQMKGWRKRCREQGTKYGGKRPSIYWKWYK